MGYGRDDPILQKLGENEPIFVLRAQDVTAPGAVRSWAATVAARGMTLKAEEAFRIADEMEKWPKRKFPD